MNTTTLQLVVLVGVVLVVGCGEPIVEEAPTFLDDSGVTVGEEAPTLIAPPFEVRVERPRLRAPLVVFVSDEGHIAVEGATVTLTAEDGARWVGETDGEGEARFSGLVEASYPVTLAVSRPGMALGFRRLDHATGELAMELFGRVPVVLYPIATQYDGFVDVQGTLAQELSPMTVLRVAPTVPGRAWSGVDGKWALRVERGVSFTLLAVQQRPAGRGDGSSRAIDHRNVAWTTIALPPATPGMDVVLDFDRKIEPEVLHGYVSMEPWVREANVGLSAVVSSRSSRFAAYLGGTTHTDVMPGANAFEVTFELIRLEEVIDPVTVWTLLDLSSGEVVSQVAVDGYPWMGPGELRFLRRPVVLNKGLVRPGDGVVWWSPEAAPPTWELMVFNRADDLVWHYRLSPSTSGVELPMTVESGGGLYRVEFPALPAGARLGEAFGPGPWELRVMACTHEYGGRCDRAGVGRALPVIFWSAAGISPDALPRRPMDVGLPSWGP